MPAAVHQVNMGTHGIAGRACAVCRRRRTEHAASEQELHMYTQTVLAQNPYIQNEADCTCVLSPVGADCQLLWLAYSQHL